MINDTPHQRALAYAEHLSPDMRYEFEERLAILRDGAPLDDWMIAIAIAQIGEATARPKAKS
jgi:hypothetical protein